LAKAWVAERDGEAIGDFHVIRCQEAVLPRFLQHVLLTKHNISLIDGSTYGAKMPRASWGFLAALQVALPSVPEQKDINRFIDHECAKIDAALLEQAVLLKLVREQVKVTTFTSLFRGLKSDVESKPTGIPWMGSVPNHWEVLRLSRITKEKCEVHLDPI
jgi:type I restriction enzyme S subunit